MDVVGASGQSLFNTSLSNLSQNLGKTLALATSPVPQEEVQEWGRGDMAMACGEGKGDARWHFPRRGGRHERADGEAWRTTNHQATKKCSEKYRTSFGHLNFYFTTI